MFGYISIPQINLKNVPIYSGDSEKAMEAGVGHIPQTSLPIGGLNTHAVLSTHSGRINNTLFTNLGDLELGDVFYIYVLNQVLKYKVDNRRIVEPSNVSSIAIVPGKDLVTLATCWPVGVNDKRLLVTAHRVANYERLPQEKIRRSKYGYSFWVMLISAFLALIGILVGLLALCRRRLHVIRIDRAQFTAIQSGSQRLIIAAKEILDADSQKKTGKTYKEGDSIIFKAWEMEKSTDGEEIQHYFRRDNNSVWVETERKHVETQKARLIWLANSVDFNPLLHQREVDLSEKFSTKHLPNGITLKEAVDLIKARLEADELPENCLLLGIKIK
jgi:LPXTG-site transpeptidase (sortase) family protein